MNYYLPTDPNIKVTARSKTLADGSLLIDWTGSGIVFNFRGKGDVILTLTQSGIDRFYHVIADGTEREIHIRSAEKSPVTIAENLPDGEHRIEFYKEMQCFNPVTIHGISLDGTLLQKPNDSELLIEFVGDSITSGSCCLGLNKDDWAWHRDDGMHSYGIYAAKILGADYSFISRGAGTLIPSAKETVAEHTSLPEVYSHTLHIKAADGEYNGNADDFWDFEKNRTANIIVINLGTNDWGVAQKQGITAKDEFLSLFENSLANFVKYAAEKNGKSTKFVFAYGMMCTQEDMLVPAYKNTAAALQKEGFSVFYCPLPTDKDGTAEHPQVKGHIKAGKVLAEFIKNNVL